MSHSTNLDKQIQNTKKTTEELKEQLKNLIDLRNTNKNFNEKENNYEQGKSNLQNSNRSPKTKCGSNENSSPIKVRNYDVCEARKYIKKQRERRLQQSKPNEDKLREEIKKQKLQELHQKAQELVLKNVQVNRQRSKSREKEEFIRLDGCDQLRNISVTREIQDLKHQITNEQRVRGRKPSNALKNKDQLSSTKNKQLFCAPPVIDISKQNKQPDEENYTHSRLSQNSTNLENKVDNLGNVQNILSHVSQREPETKFNIVSNITIRPTDNQMQKETTNNNATLKPTAATKQNSDSKIVHTDLQKTESYTKKEYPFWLQETSDVGHHLNFINTVKRKLQYVLSPQKNTVDVGVQSSMHEHNYEIPNDKNISSQINKQVSNLKSFNSHKHQYSEIKSVENLGRSLRSKHEKISANSGQNGVNISTSKTQNYTEDENESDTSKNIPDISSESGTSLKKNAESVKRNLDAEFNLSIDTEKIDNMRLVPQVKSATTTIGSDIFKKSPVDYSKSSNKRNKLETVSNITENVYDADFESDNVYTSPMLSRGRDSIITFNSPDCNENMLIPLPERIITSAKTTSKHSDHASSKMPQKASSLNSPIQTEESVNNGDCVIKTADSQKKNYKPLNIPEVLISKPIIENSFTGSTNSIISSINSNIPSSFHDISHGLQSSQIESSKMNSSQHNINTKRGSGRSFVDEPDHILPLDEPKVSLNSNSINRSSNMSTNNQDKSKLMRNISVRTKALKSTEPEKTNEIHLKFEAEIHLLNDFNQSLRQFSTVEKVVESLKSKKDMSLPNILQNKDTQTSAASKSSSAGTKSTTRMGDIRSEYTYKSKADVSKINYSREDSSDIFENLLLKFPNEDKSQLSTGLDISQLNSSKSFYENNMQHLANFENLPSNRFAGFPLNMLDQLIKDEDARLEHLKMILKIREKALLDRVRAELSWLEIQRKHYKETGNLQEVSIIKKKQRAILLNHQREKHEMQRVKQMQGEASVERKTILKEQRNLIRKQLSTDNMLEKMKVNTPRTRRNSGPLKVIQSHTESVMSETSVSRKSSTEGEIYSVTSHHSTSRLSEISEIDFAIPKSSHSDLESMKRQQNIKRTLLMREAALRKRRKEAEELLKWNRKLLEEERRIHQLELKAASMIRQQHNTTAVYDEVHTYSGKQLNSLWYNLTGCGENKFIDEKIYRMSQVAFEGFCKSAREYAVKSKKSLRKSDNSEHSAADISLSDNVVNSKTAQSSSVPSETDQKNQLLEKSVSNVSVQDYTSDFEVDATDNAVDVENTGFNENIEELIHNFSRIEDDLSSLNSKHSYTGVAIEERISESPKSVKTDSDLEISVIETNRVTLLNQENSSKDIPNVDNTENLSNKTDNVVTLTTETHDNLNESKEILLILGETETTLQKLSQQNDISELTSTANINASEEILSTLNQIVTGDKNVVNCALTNICTDTLPNNEISLIESLEERKDLHTSENILTLVPDQVENINLLLEEKCSLVNSSNESLKDTSACVSEKDVVTFASSSPNSIADKGQIKNSENQIPAIHEPKSTVDSTTISKFNLINRSDNKTDIDEELPPDLESLKKTDEKLTSSPIESNEKISSNLEDSRSAIDLEAQSNFIEDEQSGKQIETDDSETNEASDKSTSISSHLQEVNQQPNSPEIVESEQLPLTHLESLQEESVKETIAQEISTDSDSTNLNEREQSEEKSEISKVNSFTIQTDSTEIPNEVNLSDKPVIEEIAETPSIVNIIQSNQEKFSETIVEDFVPIDLDKTTTSPKSRKINIKKRVSEIMADANQVSKGGDKSPRLQDFYTTTYDLVSPAVSPELGSPPGDNLKIALSTIFGNEAEEILKKQLAIEQEIKQITEQQQKQQLPYMYVREIPNKPPPPYTPPTSLSSTITSVVVIPTVEEIDEITKYSAKILHKAYLSSNLENISISDYTLGLISKNIPKEKYKFIFDLCKDISKDHYKQFKQEKCPMWLQVCNKPQLTISKPFEVNELTKYMSKKVKEVFGYEKSHKRENSIIKWSRKKRDHVDEILVGECQTEEVEWINYEKDELLVINQITNDIMDMLLKEATNIFSNFFPKPQL